MVCALRYTRARLANQRQRDLRFISFALCVPSLLGKAWVAAFFTADHNDPSLVVSGPVHS
jgi:hypothetical protein